MTDQSPIDDLIRRVTALEEAVERLSTGHPKCPPDCPPDMSTGHFDPVAEKRREYDRNRKRAQRAVHRTVHRTDIRASSSSFLLPSLNSTSLLNLELEGCAREKPDGFDQFWSAYPHKVGKIAARKMFAKARKRVPLEIMMKALAQYAAKRDDRPWCNPATWLNEGRWDDQPGGVNGKRPPSAMDGII